MIKMHIFPSVLPCYQLPSLLDDPITKHRTCVFMGTDRRIKEKINLGTVSFSSTQHLTSECAPTSFQGQVETSQFLHIQVFVFSLKPF